MNRIQTSINNLYEEGIIDSETASNLLEASKVYTEDFSARSMMKRLILKSCEADENLLNQYKKELSDLENGTGLAKSTPVHEVNSVKARLRSSIKSLEDSLKRQKFELDNYY